MDAVSYAHSAKQAKRIKKFIENPDSNSGIVTVPKVIGAGENITIPAGRMAVLPNVQVDGTLNIEGEVFVPSGTTFGDLENQIALKAPLASPALTGTPTAPTAAVTTNNTQIASTGFVRSIIPTGLISMWSGSIASIPAGWALCNGQNGTPNLQDRFVIGAGSAYAVGGTGGNKDAIVVSHTHTQAEHNHTATTSSAGEHAHTFTTGYADDLNGGQYIPSVDNLPGGSRTATTSSSGTHSHSLTTTTVTPTINSTGSAGTNANLPPYYALAYIMKL